MSRVGLGLAGDPRQRSTVARFEEAGGKLRRMICADLPLQPNWP